MATTTIPLAASVSPTAVQTIGPATIPDGSGSYFVSWDVSDLFTDQEVNMTLEGSTDGVTWTPLLIATGCAPGDDSSKLPGSYWLGYTTTLSSVGLQVQVVVTFSSGTPFAMPAASLTVNPVQATAVP